MLLLFNYRRLKFNFLKSIWNKSSSWAALLKCWFRTDLGHENSTGFYIYMRGRQSLLTFLTVTRWSRSTSNSYVLIGQNLTDEFMRKIYAASGNLLTDSWSLQSFVSSCDVLNWLFLLGVQLLRFLLTNAPLVKVIGNPISDGIVFKNELTHLPLLEAKEDWKVSSDSGTLADLPKHHLDRSAWAIIVFDVFFFRFPEIERIVYAA